MVIYTIVCDEYWFILCNLFAGTGNAKIHLHAPATIYAGEAITVNCTGTKQDFQYVFMPIMSLTSRSDCDIQDVGGYGPKRFKNYYLKSFTITCKKGSHKIECKTNSNSMHQNAAVQLQGVLYSTHQHNNIMYVFKLQFQRGQQK